MKALAGFTRVVDRLTDSLGWVSQLLAFVTVLLTFYNVLARYIGKFIGMQLSNNRLLETQWYLFSMVFFLSFAYIVRHGINVRVDFIYANWPRKRQARLDYWGNWFFLFPFILMGIWVAWSAVMTSWGRPPNGTLLDGISYLFGGDVRWNTWEVSPDPGGWPRAPIKSMIIISFVLLLLQAIVEQIKLWARISGNDEHFDMNDEPDAPIRIE